MHPILRNTIALFMGGLAGMVINAGFIRVGAGFLPVPEGVIPTDFESIQAHADLYTSRHFILPFLAHAVATLSGAYTVSRIAVSNYKKLSLSIGGFFLLGGIMMAIGLPAFWKFAIVDILFAYFPMAILGWKIAGCPE